MFVGHDWGSMVVWQPRLLAPRAGRRRRRHERAVPPARCRCRRSQLMRQRPRRHLLLHPLLPGARRRRRRPRRATRPRRCGACSAACPPTGGSGPDPSFFANDGRGFVERMPEPDALPDWLTPGRARPLRRRVHAHRLHRRHQLVPQLRPQLGAHRAPRRRQGRGAVAVHRRWRRPRAADVAARRRWTAGSPTTAATSSSTAPATGCSRRRPTRSTPRSLDFVDRSRRARGADMTMTSRPGRCASARSSPRSTPSGRTRRSPSSTTSTAPSRSTGSATTRCGSASTTPAATSSSAAPRSSSPPPPSARSTSSSAPASPRCRTTTRGWSPTGSCCSTT